MHKYDFQKKELSFSEISKLLEISDLKLKNKTKLDFFVSQLNEGNTFFFEQIIIYNLNNKSYFLSGEYQLSLIKEYLKTHFNLNLLNTKLSVTLINLKSKEELIDLKNYF